MVTDGGVIFEEFIPGYNTNLHQCNFGRSSRGHAQFLQVDGGKEGTEGITTPRNYLTQRKN